MEVNNPKIKVGDYVRNTVGLMLFISKIDEERSVAYLVYPYGDTLVYRIDRIIENIKSGKWTLAPKTKSTLLI